VATEERIEDVAAQEHMKDGQHRYPDRAAAAVDLHQVLSMTISIFDTAITLLGEPPEDGVKMPTGGYVACMISILRFLGVGPEKD
jgi:hypothetical protein